MKKLLIVLVLFVSCQQEKIAEHMQHSIAVFSPPADQATGRQSYLYAPEDEGGWQAGRVGLFNARKSIVFTTANSWLSEQYGGKVAIGQNVKMVDYDCLIGNGVPGDNWDTAVNNPITRTGIRDLVVNNDGSESIPIQITTYVNGGVYLGRKKDEFDYTPTDRRLNAASGILYSGKDYLWHGWGDNYSNSAIIPFADGKYVIAVTINYNGSGVPTSSLLPISVTGNTVVTDTTAIYLNAALPASNVKAILQHGKVKGVNIDFTGNAYAYCLAKFNETTKAWEMLFVWQDTRHFFDPTGNKFSKYKIISRNQGRIPDNETTEFKPTVK